MNFARATDGKSAGGGLGWLLLAQSVIYAVAVLMLTGLVPDWGQWYSRSHFRAQTAAVLRGELALSPDPGRLEHDLSWSGSGVQQVWGLGIPLWRLPFEAMAMWLGQPGFPDRLALGLFLAVTAWVVLRTFVEPGLAICPPMEPGPAIGDGPGSRAAPPSLGAGLGGAVLLLGFAPFWSVMRSRGAIYEEVLIYVYLYGLLLACGVVALARRPGWGRFWWLCALAGLGGLIRPTLVFYGMATLLTASAVLALSLGRSLPTGPWLAGDKPRGLRLLRDRRWWIGVAIYLGGGALLWGTNLLRFGDGFEFGHRLNLQDELLLGSIYATRFDHPFQAEPLWRAGRELLGALFASPNFNGSDWYATGLFAAQSPTVRWREFYFTTYDWSYLLLIAGGWVGGGWVLRRWCKGRMTGDQSSPASARAATLPELAVLVLWSWLVCAPLTAFYLRAPAISSRYLLDFGAAFAVAILVAWCLAAERAGRRGRWLWPQAVLWMLLLGWLGWQFRGLEGAYSTWRPVTGTVISWEQETPRNADAARPLPSAYQAGEDLSRYGIRFNGAGWASDGAVQVSLILFVEDPRFLELELASAPLMPIGREEAEQIRAKVGLEYLKRESIERTEAGWRVRFAGPKQARYRHGLQAVFVAMVSTDRLAEAQTGWLLRRVSWRKERRRTSSRRPIEPKKTMPR